MEIYMSLQESMSSSVGCSTLMLFLHSFPDSERTRTCYMSPLNPLWYK
jgi:hypothetical protein